jgi:hypothetical protein
MAISRRKALQFSGVVAATAAISGCSKTDSLKPSPTSKTKIIYKVPIV